MKQTIYSGHLSIEDIIFKSQFTLPFRIDLSIADKPNNSPYKTFLVRNLYTFYFRQHFKVSRKFSSIFILLFSQFIKLFRSIKMIFLNAEISAPRTFRDFRNFVNIPKQIRTVDSEKIIR